MAISKNTIASIRELAGCCCCKGSSNSSNANYTAGTGIIIENNVISINVSDTVQEGDMNPVTSNAVYQVLGNINDLLGGI